MERTLQMNRKLKKYIKAGLALIIFLILNYQIATGFDSLTTYEGFGFHGGKYSSPEYYHWSFPLIGALCAWTFFFVQCLSLRASSWTDWTPKRTPKKSLVDICLLGSAVGIGVCLIAPSYPTNLYNKLALLLPILLLAHVLVYIARKHLTIFEVSPKEMVIQRKKILLPGEQFTIASREELDDTMKVPNDSKLSVRGEIGLGQTVWVFYARLRQMVDLNTLQQLNIRGIDWNQIEKEITESARIEITHALSQPLDSAVTEMKRSGWKAPVELPIQLFLEALCLDEGCKCGRC